MSANYTEKHKVFRDLSTWDIGCNSWCNDCTKKSLFFTSQWDEEVYQNHVNRCNCALNLNDIMDASIAAKINTNTSKLECDMQLEVMKLEMHIWSSQPNHEYIDTANIKWFYIWDVHKGSEAWIYILSLYK